MADAYDEGREAYRVWVTSPVTAQFDPETPAEVAMRYFLPPIEQSMAQFVQPLPADRREWLRGFEDARAER